MEGLASISSGPLLVGLAAVQWHQDNSHTVGHLDASVHALVRSRPKLVENLRKILVSSPQVGLHGAPLIFGLAMRPGSAIVEIRPNRFEGEKHSVPFWRALWHCPRMLPV